MVALEVHIEKAGHIRVLSIDNIEGGRDVDMIPLEEIELLVLVEERSFLLGKLMSEVVVEKGGFT